MATDGADIQNEKKEKTFALVNITGTQTGALLIKPVAGRYQLVSSARVPSTMHPPRASIIHGVVAALEEIGRSSGHTLISGEGDLIRDTRRGRRGAEFLGVTTISPTPIRVSVLTEIEDEPALESVQRVLETLGGRLVGVWPADDGTDWQDQLSRFSGWKPDVAVIVGGDGLHGQRLLGELSLRLRYALHQFEPHQKPAVVFAGQKEVEATVRENLGDEIDLHVAQNIRPRIKRERPGPLRRLLVELEEELKLKQLDGMAELMRWGLTQPLAATDCMADFVAFRSQVKKGAVLCVHHHDQQLTLILGLEGQSRVLTRREFGLGQGIGQLLSHLPVETILNWIAGEDPEKSMADLDQFLTEQALYPGTVPQTERDFLLFEGILLSMLEAAGRQAKESWGMAGDPLEVVECIVGGTLLQYVPDGHKLINLILTALAPAGTFPVILDSHDLVAGLGRLAREEPLAAVQVAESAAFMPAYWAVCPLGSGRSGKDVVSITAGEQPEQVTSWGAIKALSLLVNSETAALTIKPARGVNIGRGRGKSFELSSGQIASARRLVVDGRGRPLDLPSDPQERHRLLARWRLQLGE